MLAVLFHPDEQPQGQELKHQCVLFSQVAPLYKLDEIDQQNREREERGKRPELGSEQFAGSQAGPDQKSELDQPDPPHLGEKQPGSVYEVEQRTLVTPPVDIRRLPFQYALGNVQESARISVGRLHKAINRIEEKDPEKQRPDDDGQRISPGLRVRGPGRGRNSHHILLSFQKTPPGTLARQPAVVLLDLSAPGTSPPQLALGRAVVVRKLSVMMSQLEALLLLKAERAVPEQMRHETAGVSDTAFLKAMATSYSGMGTGRGPGSPISFSDR